MTDTPGASDAVLEFIKFAAQDEAAQAAMDEAGWGREWSSRFPIADEAFPTLPMMTPGTLPPTAPRVPGA